MATIGWRETEAAREFKRMIRESVLRTGRCEVTDTAINSVWGEPVELSAATMKMHITRLMTGEDRPIPEFKYRSQEAAIKGFALANGFTLTRDNQRYTYIFDKSAGGGGLDNGK